MIRLLKANHQVVRFVDLSEAGRGLEFDIRYATTDNFVKRKVYPTAHAFLLEHVAEDLFDVHDALKKEGFGLLIFDGYRPWSVSKLFWDISSEHDRKYLADPAQGSAHNRGCAVDLSMFDLETKAPIVMPSDFDEMNEKAHATYIGGDPIPRLRRDLLRRTMLNHNFQGIANEWWHYNHISRHDWPVMNFSFKEILK